MQELCGRLPTQNPEQQGKLRAGTSRKAVHFIKKDSSTFLTVPAEVPSVNIEDI